MIYIKKCRCESASECEYTANLTNDLPWWPSCGALIYVDAPGCGTSVVRGPTGAKVGRFSS